MTQSGLPLDPATYRMALAQASDPPHSTGALQLGRALRRLNAIVAACRAPQHDLNEAAAGVESIVHRLQPYAEASRFPMGERLGTETGMFVNHPLIGALHPGSPPIVLRPSDARLFGYATYGPAFEGPRGYVHGGHMAAGFDAMVVMTAGLEGLGGVTRSLAVRYRRPAPLAVELCYEGVVESTSERSTIVHVVLRHGDQVCAECTGDVATGRGPRVPADAL